MTRVIAGDLRLHSVSLVEERQALPHCRVTRVLVDTLAAAAAVSVKPGVIRKWAHRGHLQRRGEDARRRTLYDLEDVHDTARGWCRWPDSTRCSSNVLERSSTAVEH